jgi:hypothetical protein
MTLPRLTLRSLTLSIFAASAIGIAKVPDGTLPP